MKKRACVLHNLLNKCVQRKDYEVIKDQIQPKREYVLSVRLSDKQIELYRAYYEHRNLVHDLKGCKMAGAQIFADFQQLARIWTHPWSIMIKHERDSRAEERAADRDADRDFIDDDDDSGGAEGRRRRGSSDTASTLDQDDLDVKSEPSVPSSDGVGDDDDDENGNDDDIIEIEHTGKLTR